MSSPLNARESRTRFEMVVLAVLVMGCSGMYAVPAFLEGWGGLFPASVTCSELAGERAHPEHDGRYVVLLGCVPELDEVRGSVDVFNQGVGELEIELYTSPRKPGAKPVATAIVRRADLVSPFSHANAQQTASLRRGEFAELDPATAERLTSAKARIHAEFADGARGVLRGRSLVHGDPPGFGLGYAAIFAGGAVLAALGAFAPRDRMAGLLAMFAGRS